MRTSHSHTLDLLSTMLKKQRQRKALYEEADKRHGEILDEATKALDAKHAENTAAKLQLGGLHTAKAQKLSMEKQIEDMSAQIAGGESHINDFRANLEEILAANRGERQKVANFEVMHANALSEKDNLAASITHANSLRQTIRAEILDAETQSKERNTKQALELRIKELSRAIAAAEDTKADLEAEMRRQELLHDEHQEWNAQEIARLKAELDKIAHAKAKTDEELGNLSSSSKRMAATIRNLTARKVANEATAASLRTDIGHMRGEVEDLRSKLQSAQARSQHTSTEKFAGERQNRAIAAKLEELREELRSVRDEVADTTMKHRVLQEKETETQKILSALQSANRLLELDCAEAADNSHQESRKRESLQESISKVEGRIEAARRHLDGIADAIVDANEKEDALKKDLDEHRKEILAQKNSLKNLSGTKRNLIALGAKFDKVEESLHRKIQELTDEYEKQCADAVTEEKERKDTLLVIERRTNALEADIASLLTPVGGGKKGAKAKAARFETAAMKAFQRKRDIAAMRKNAAFQSLSDSLISETLDRCPIHVYAKDAVLITEGDLGFEAYLILEGSVSITKRMSGGDVKVLTARQSGQWFGEFALLNDSPRAASVIAAIENTRVLRVSRHSFMHINEKAGGTLMKSIKPQKSARRSLMEM
eukprot:g4325.t1